MRYSIILVPNSRSMVGVMNTDRRKHPLSTTTEVIPRLASWLILLEESECLKMLQKPSKMTVVIQKCFYMLSLQRGPSSRELCGGPLRDRFLNVAISCIEISPLTASIILSCYTHCAKLRVEIGFKTDT